MLRSLLPCLCRHALRPPLVLQLAMRFNALSPVLAAVRDHLSYLRSVLFAILLITISTFSTQAPSAYPLGDGLRAPIKLAQSNLPPETLPAQSESIDGARAPSGGDGASEVLNVDSHPGEPAVPLNLSLKVRVVTLKRLIEVTVIVAKRGGYPTDLFFDRNVTAQIALLPGLQLEEGSLSWSGDLKGDQVAEFVAKVRAVQDTEGVVEVTAIGHGLGGRIDADKERFHVLVSGEQIRASLEPPRVLH